MDNEEELEQKNKTKAHIFFSFIKVLAVIVTTATITYFYTINVSLKSYISNADSNYLSTKMSLIENKLKDSYIYDMNKDDMIETAIKGYVAGLKDTYTKYLTVEDMKSLRDSTSGSYVCLGVCLADDVTNNRILVVGIIEGSEAERVGIQVGDSIVKVNDVDYTGEQIDNAIEALKGEEGSHIKVTVSREDKNIDYDVIRSSIKVKSVGSKMLENKIAYIKIASFNVGTAEEFINNYKELQKDDPKALIIDLRENGGGVVEEALKIADCMVEKGKTLLITTNKEKKEKMDIASQEPIINIPVVILVNDYTASASEILAGCLRDNCNYKIIGTTSYGKGVIQSVFSFVDGSGLKVTTEEYFTPNHNVINKVGIKPDIEVELDEKWKGYSNVPYQEDTQLQKAIEECNK